MSDKDKKSILVIDDEEEIRFLLETKFYKLGYDVDTAATAMQAITKIKSGKIYNLVISDLKMPKLSGVDFYTQLVASSPNTKFILITGYPEKDKLMSAMKKGIVNIMLKPVKHSEIVGKVEELIGVPASRTSES